MRPRIALAASLLLLIVIATGAALAWWKYQANQAAGAMSQPEQMESVTTAVAAEQPYRRSVTAIGTVLALRSITLRNEVAGKVIESNLVSGEIVEAGALLVALDVAVESAELAAQKAEVVVAEQNLDRLQRALAERAASAMEVDRARANRDVAVAHVARLEALIARKTIRAPFRARVGLADVHRGQYLSEGTQLTTLQDVADTVYVDFAVTQQVLAELATGATVEILTSTGERASTAKISAVDARVDASTRTGMLRAMVERTSHELKPGSSVRVRVPYGPARNVVVVPVTAVRKGPTGSHVFVIEPDQGGSLRAHLRPVQSGAMLGDLTVIHDGLKTGEKVAASGSFKLREGVLVVVAQDQAAGQPAGNGK